MDHAEQGRDRPHPGQEHAELVIREPEDLLGYIPHAMGEWPSESLVAVTVGAGTVGVTVRVDLPSPRDGDLEAYAESVCGYLATDALADGAVLAVYTAQPWAELADPPRHDLVTELQAALARAGLPVLDAWLVGDIHWRSLLCRRSSCCPWPGERVERIAASRLGTELVYRGSTFEAASGGRPLRVTGPRSRSRPRASSEEHLLSDHYDVHMRSWWDPREFAAALAAWDDTLGDSRAPGPERLGLLAASLVRPALRDAVIVAAALNGRAAWLGTVVLGGLDRGGVPHEKHDGGTPTAGPEAAGRSGAPGGADGADGADLGGVGLGGAGLGGADLGGAGLVELRGDLPELPGGLPLDEVRRIVAGWTGQRAGDEDGFLGDSAGDQCGPELVRTDLEEEAALAFGGVLLGSTPGPPSWERIDRLERVLRTLTAMEAPEVRAPALAVLGWICWVRGRGAKAVGFLRRALSAAPDYRFAELFIRVVESGELAAWARRPETAWRRLSDVA